MQIRTIQNKKEYKAALDEIEQLWSAPAKSAQAHEPVTETNIYLHGCYYTIFVHL